MFGSPVPSEIRDRFKELEGPTVVDDPLASQNPPLDKYLGSRTPFTRMWTAVHTEQFKTTPPNNETILAHSDKETEENGYRYYYYRDDFKFEARKEKLEVYESEVRTFIINDNNQSSYEQSKKPMESIRTGLGEMNELSNNKLRQPTAGITSVSSKTQGALGALINTSVEFKVYNLHDFENIFLPYFMRPGSIVCVDFGWSDMPGELYNPNDHIDQEDRKMSAFESFLYGTNKITGELDKKKGKMKTVMGNVVKYDAKVQNDGSFDCSIEIVSRNSSVLNKEMEEDGKLKFIFGSLMDDLILLYLLRLKGLPEPVHDQIQVIETLISADGNVDASEESKRILSSLLESPNKLGNVSKFGKKQGIYFQNLPILAEAESPTLTEGAALEKLDPNETTYITWGLFEDIFLNKFIVPVKEKTEAGNTSSEPLRFDGDFTEDFGQKFDSRRSFVRWSEDIEKIQRAAGSGAVAFMFPDEWDTTRNFEIAKWTKEETKKIEGSNSKTPFTEKCKKGYYPGYEGRGICPLRDVFINIDIIQKAFRNSSNLNKALTKILDKLSEESADIWNLKISGGTEAATKIDIRDINLLPNLQNEKDILTFNVTGDQSIVSEFDISFSTPSDGLSAILAIGNLESPVSIDQQLAGTLNFLNVLNKPERGFKSKPTVVKSLPIRGVTDKDNLDLSGAIDVEDFLGVSSDFFSQKTINAAYSANQNADAITRNINTTGASNAQRVKKVQFNEFKNFENYYTYKADVEKKVEEYEKNQGIKNKVNKANKSKVKSNIDFVKDEREYFKEEARKNFFHRGGSDSMSPILPIKLSLSVYGNDNLQIGDYLTVNYLPKFYRERVFFQTYGISHKVDSNSWTTTYDPLIFRVKPDFKSLASGGAVQRSTRVIGDNVGGMTSGEGGDEVGDILRELNSSGDKALDFGFEGEDDKTKSGDLNFTAKISHLFPPDLWKEVVKREYQEDGELTQKQIERTLEFTSTAINEKTYFVEIDNHKDYALANAIRDVLLGNDVINYDKAGTFTEIPKKPSDEDIYLTKSSYNNKSYIFKYPKNQKGSYVKEFIEDSNTKQKLDIVKRLTDQWTYNSYLSTFLKLIYPTFEIDPSYWPSGEVEYSLPPLFSHFHFNNDHGMPEEEIKILRVKIHNENINVFQNIAVPMHILKVSPKEFCQKLSQRYLIYKNLLSDIDAF